MRAIILAAGFSTRLYPLTRDVPKGLLMLGNKTIASYTADDIVNEKKIEEAVMVTNSCFYSDFRKWADIRYGSRLKVINNGVDSLDRRLGAIGDILFTLDKTGWDDDLLVATSDTLASLDISGFIRFFSARGGVTTAVFKTDDPKKIAGKLGCAVLEEDRIVSFVEKPENPPSQYIGVPFYIFPKTSLRLIRAYKNEGNQLDAPGSIIGWFISKGPVYGYEFKGYYYDVGTVEIYESLKSSFAP